MIKQNKIIILLFFPCLYHIFLISFFQVFYNNGYKNPFFIFSLLLKQMVLFHEMFPEQIDIFDMDIIYPFLVD